MTGQPNAYTHTVAGMLQKLKMIQAITNNISHANTVGYKREIPESINFESILSEVGLKDPSQGDMKKTNNRFDFAIEGNASFLIETKDGPVPTRNERFHLNEKGLLVNEEGKELVVIEKSAEPMSLAKAATFKVNENGEIHIGGQKYGRIALQISDNKPIVVHQGFVEGSNVNLMDEAVSLQMILRSFEASEKLLGMEASVDKELIEKYGRNV